MRGGGRKKQLLTVNSVNHLSCLKKKKPLSKGEC